MGICIDMLTLVTAESNKFIGDMPDTPDNLVCIYETGGYDPEIQMSKSIIERPTFMIKVRDTSYTAGISRCEVIKASLNTVTNTTINSHTYIEVFLTGGVNTIGKDSRNRWEFSMNFRSRLIK